MKHPVTIRAAVAADTTFLVDSNVAMALETEQKNLDRDILRRGIEAVFAQTRRGFYRIADRDGVAVGCLLVTREWSDWRNGDWWWIQSVYVVREARRSGVFTALYADVENHARSTPGVVGLRLYVEHENHGAQATYVGLGMRDSGYRLLERSFAGSI